LVERLVVQAAREVQMLAALAPVEAHRERERLVSALQAGRPVRPRWYYAPVAHDELRRALDAAERALEEQVETGVDVLLLERVRELSLEAAICAAAGTRDVSALGRQRFDPGDPPTEQEAARLCASWIAPAAGDDAGAPLASTVPSDAANPRSLLSRMRASVGGLRLPFAVVPHPALAPLAATGDGVILVATDRPVTDEDAERTVLHEIEGHARPRARALRAELPLLRAGTARGVDDQEGRALVIEERAGMLGARRRRQLAARHRAVEAMLAGAAFDEVTAALVREHRLDPRDAVVVAERAFRGGDGTRPGLGRERVYLEAFVRVRSHLAAHPEDEPALAAGQIAVAAIDALRCEVAGLGG
jgi:hypothetical protein